MIVEKSDVEWFPVFLTGLISLILQAVAILSQNKNLPKSANVANTNAD